ncbi:DHA2 family efflux MFS transporter permease subunit [Achromobacter seleniivolatilans]|uniref:DHA2 family efflux MFS transporter permease subunit n=1 Tax=Achromobacter seleniivolatilans TaxID=3047478 RepID=A0ABY9M9X0_9BURK|nr:DHA2 family efflux MFS transporter permease subunit [Achromobacter sp. R39]WMD23635.1 DHA2 family efflux MFS transporter permease subunit [Achromobacter sp. R39]
MASNPSRRRAALGAAYLGTFLATLDISIVNVALPTLQEALQTDIAGLQWVVNAYAICLSAFMLSSGPLCDRYGHKRAWLAGVLLFTAGSALCAIATSLELLLAGRAIQGVAGALLIPGALPILTNAFPDPKARAHVIGGWSAFSALALILGPLLGGLLLDGAGWQSIFLINLPLGLIAIGLGLWGISERKYPEHAALDPIGQLLSVLCLAALTYGLIEAGEHGVTGTSSLIALPLAAVGFIAFAIVEMRVRRPLIPLSLFCERSFAIVNFASFALGFSYYSSLFFFSIFLQNIQGWSPVETGWRMMPQFVVTGCVSILFGRLSAAFPVRWLMVAGYGLTAVSMGAMATFTAHTPYWIVGSLFGLLGLGAGLAVPATGLAVMTAAPADRAGTASATMNALRQMGMTLGIAFLGALMSKEATRMLASHASELGVSNAAEIAQHVITHGVVSSRSPLMTSLYVPAMEHGFHIAMIFSGLASAIAMVLLLTLSREAHSGLQRAAQGITPPCPPADSRQA